MIEHTNEIICIFSTNNLLLNAEDVLTELDLPYELIPVPKQVYSNCGLALSVKEEEFDEIVSVLRNAGYEPGTIYKRRGDEFERL
ncbi:DUF3343 domain-containing protein [Deltaproteobacteria bacterium OttesenSCG-928-M10]|nr:DUF3343 domain-containing protein [Deltaproteobacteria bacterium OttesenSCG-928-M10]